MRVCNVCAHVITGGFFKDEALHLWGTGRVAVSESALAQWQSVELVNGSESDHVTSPCGLCETPCGFSTYAQATPRVVLGAEAPAKPLAAQHADSLLATFTAHTDTGYPFGVSNLYSGDTFSDMTEALEETPDDERDSLGEASAMDWLSDVLDIHYTVTSDRQYRSARVLIGYGGPNVWIDTAARELEVYWGSGAERRSLPSSFIRGLDDALEELWEVGA